MLFLAGFDPAHSREVPPNIAREFMLDAARQ
jgi:hypothetical protein